MCFCLALHELRDCAHINCFPFFVNHSSSLYVSKISGESQWQCSQLQCLSTDVILIDGYWTLVLRWISFDQCFFGKSWTTAVLAPSLGLGWHFAHYKYLFQSLLHIFIHLTLKRKVSEFKNSILNCEKKMKQFSNKIIQYMDGNKCNIIK